MILTSTWEDGHWQRWSVESWEGTGMQREWILTVADLPSEFWRKQLNAMREHMNELILREIEAEHAAAKMKEDFKRLAESLIVYKTEPIYETETDVSKDQIIIAHNVLLPKGWSEKHVAPRLSRHDRMGFHRKRC